MKKIINVFTLFLIALFVLPSQILLAQNFVLPTLSESLLDTGHQAIKTALIDYTPNCTAIGGCGSAQLKVVGYGAGNPLFPTPTDNGVFVDDGLGGPVSMSLSSPNPFALSVVVGNSTSNTADYLVGCLRLL